MKTKLLFTLSVLLFSLMISNATETIRELWDGVGKSDVGSSSSMNGFGNGRTSLGFAPGSTWQDPYALSNALLQCDINFDDATVCGLPTSAFSIGALWSDVFWGTSATIPINSPSNWVARALAPAAQINFNANGVYYFSLDCNHGGDSAGGIAFATGTNVTDRFVGAGITWETYPTLSGPNPDLGDSDYICQGSFGDPSDTNSSLPEAQGLYAIKSYGALNLLSGYTKLVGQIITTVGGNTTVNVKAYNSATTTTADTSVSTVVWDATYTFTETNVMKYMICFMNSETPSYPYFEEGSMRVATTFGEVMGIESYDTVIPTNVVATGFPVTFSNTAAFLAPVSYQWATNGVPIPNATNATYTIASPSTANSAVYDLIVSNAFGESTNNPSITLTVLPPQPPSITAQPPLPTSRLPGGSLSLTATVAGSPPFTYQWFQNGSPVPAPAGTNKTLNFLPVQLANGGSYYLHVSNLYGSTNSLTNNFTVVTPSGFDTAVVADQPWAYWSLSETNGTVLHDLYSGNDGVAPDTADYQGYNAGANSFGVPGPAYAGFSSGNTAIGTINGYAIPPYNASAFSRLQVPSQVTYGSNMTMVIWLNCDNAFLNDDQGVITYRDLSSGGGYGNIYGIQTADALGQIGWSWGSVNDYNGQATGLIMPTNGWVFLAIEVDPTNVTTYMGNATTPLTAILSTNTDNATYTNVVGLFSNYSPQTFAPPYNVPGGLMDIGNVNYPYASGGGALQATASFKDAAIFNSSLSFNQILRLYLSAMGTGITIKPNGPRSISLNWFPGATLQSATSLNGPWTTVPGSPAPPYSVPASGSQVFYRTVF